MLSQLEAPEKRRTMSAPSSPALVLSQQLLKRGCENEPKLCTSIQILKMLVLFIKDNQGFLKTTNSPILSFKAVFIIAYNVNIQRTFENSKCKRNTY